VASIASSSQSALRRISSATFTRTTAGKATLFVASAVAGGYGSLALSCGFNIHIWFAILIMSAMLVSCLGALTLLPNLILTFRPRFIFRRDRVPASPPVARPS
jgi:predicted RND superfamily exporter protein